MVERRKYLLAMTKYDLGDVQSTLQSRLPCSLQIDMLKRPKLALIKLINLPSSH